MRFRLCSTLATAVAVVALTTVSGAPASAAEQPIVVAGPIAENGEVSRATCPAGTQLVGGGYDARHSVNGLNNVTDGLVSFMPDPQKPNTWGARMLRGPVRSLAMCAKGDGPAPTVVAGPTAANGGTSKATCPEGTALVSGGYDSIPSVNGLGVYVDAVDTNAPTNDNSWVAKMTLGTARAFALCAS